MARNRIIYQSEALFAGQKTNTNITDAHTDIGDGDPSTAHIKQIHRVQSANYAFNISRSDVNQFGELAAIDRVVLDTPTVSLAGCRDKVNSCFATSASAPSTNMCDTPAFSASRCNA